MISQLRFLRAAIRDYGLPWVLRRGTYEFQVRGGWHRLKFPQRQWDSDELARWLPRGEDSDPEIFFRRWKEERNRFFFNPEDREQYHETLVEILGEGRLKELTNEAENIGKGEFTYFFKHKGELGFPPDWHLNPFTQGRSDPKAHWTRLPMYSPIYGDMKFVWEPGRFASAYTLARAYWASGNEEFGETFWQLIESWKGANHPNHGAHWKCGQEASLRLMAWYFGLHAFLEAPATTPERFVMLAGMAAAQADRIERDHVYSHLQQNNHAMSEGVGLYATGLLFPQFARSKDWRKRGLEILEEEGIALIKPKGTFRQKSHNYHRLMLHLYLYAGRLAELNGDRFSEALTQRLRNAADYLYQVQDSETGKVPNFGANDGALVFPANSCDYQDYRPVCAAGHYFFEKKRVYKNGHWDEDLLWLYGPSALTSQMNPPGYVDLAKNSGGIYTLRGERSWAFTHCESFGERPGQADALNFDLWWRGVNITVDPGSYRYFAKPPWNMGLKGTRSHSTVTVDDVNQLQRGPRGMYTDWHSASVNVRKKSSELGIEYLEAEHGAYLRLPDPVIHRRLFVRAGDDCWMIIDDLLGEKKHDLVLHWLLADFPYGMDEDCVVLNTKSGEFRVTTGVLGGDKGESRVEIVRGSEESAPRGWISHYYGHREAAISFRRHYRGLLPCRLYTLLTPYRYAVEHREIEGGKTRIEIEGSNLQMLLGPPGATPVIESINWEKSLVFP